MDSSTSATLKKLTLEFNNFEFSGVHYLQINGTSLSTLIGPNYAYANIFMGLPENEFLVSLLLTQLYYKRFIGGIFMIRQHEEIQLLSFIYDFINVHLFTFFSMLTRAINFLDVTMMMCDGQLTCL